MTGLSVVDQALPVEDEWDVVLVHDRDDVVTDTIGGLSLAIEWARAEDAKRHRDNRPCVFDSPYVAKTDSFVQHGTDRHYVSFTRTATSTSPVPATIGASDA